MRTEILLVVGVSGRRDANESKRFGANERGTRIACRAAPVTLRQHAMARCSVSHYRCRAHASIYLAAVRRRALNPACVSESAQATNIQEWRGARPCRGRSGRAPGSACGRRRTRAGSEWGPHPIQSPSLGRRRGFAGVGRTRRPGCAARAPAVPRACAVPSKLTRCARSSCKVPVFRDS